MFLVCFQNWCVFFGHTANGEDLFSETFYDEGVFFFIYGRVSIGYDFGCNGLLLG